MFSPSYASEKIGFIEKHCGPERIYPPQAINMIFFGSRPVNDTAEKPGRPMNPSALSLYSPGSADPPTADNTELEHYISARKKWQATNVIFHPFARYSIPTVKRRESPDRTKVYAGEITASEMLHGDFAHSAGGR